MRIEERDKDTPHVLPISDDFAAARAIQAVSLGVASPDQQKAAIKYIMYSICMLNRPAYLPGDDQRRNTDILIGMQQAAHEINKRVFANINTLEEFNNAKEQSNGRQQHPARRSARPSKRL